MVAIIIWFLNLIMNLEYLQTTPDILTINKTLFDCAIPHVQVCLLGYTGDKNDRTRCDGGVCFYRLEINCVI